MLKSGEGWEIPCQPSRNSSIHFAIVSHQPISSTKIRPSIPEIPGLDAAKIAIGQWPTRAACVVRQGCDDRPKQEREDSMIGLRRALGALALLAIAATASAGAAEPVLPTAASPEDVGLSSSQLARIEAVTQKHIEAGLVPGAVMLVARRGKIAWARTMGFRDRGAKRSDAAGFDLPDLFHDQADRFRRRHDAGRGRQDADQRSRLEIHPRIRQDEGRRREDRGRQARTGRSRPRDDGAGSAAAHLRPDLRHPRQIAGQCRLYRVRDRQSRLEQRGIRCQSGKDCRCGFRRASAGNMACRPTYSAAWSRWCRANRSANS